MAEREMVLGEWAAEWFRIHAEGKPAPNTVGGYRNLIFNHIVPKLGGAALTGLDSLLCSWVLIAQKTIGGFVLLKSSRKEAM